MWCGCIVRPMESNRERIIQLGQEITVIRQQLRETEPLRQKLSELEAELDALLGTRGREQGPVHNGDGAESRLVEGSMASRIVEALQSVAPKPANAQQVQKRLGTSNINSVRGTLLRLAESGLIERPERGQYRAKGRAM